jgi:transcriptional regulator with XRE-family HTH domain
MHYLIEKVGLNGPLGVAAEIVSSYALAVVPSIGDNLRRLRGSRSQKEVAQKMGVPQPQVSDWERDRYGTLDLATLFRLAIGYDCAIEEIVAGVDRSYGDRRELVRQSSDERTSPPPPERRPDVAQTTGAEAGRVESKYRELIAATQEIAHELLEVLGEHRSAAEDRSAMRSKPGVRPRPR